MFNNNNVVSSAAHGNIRGKISSYTGAADGVVVDSFLFSFVNDCKCHLVNGIPMRNPCNEEH